MSFLSVLKKIGTVIINTAGIAEGIGPLLPFATGSKASGEISNATNDLTQVAGIITTIETAFAAVSSAPTGSLKLQAAAPLVSQVIQKSLLVGGRHIAQPDLFNKGVVDLTTAVVEILNSLEPSGISTTGTGATPITTPSPTIPAPLAPGTQVSP